MSRVRTCLMSELTFHTNMRFVLSELMLHTKICNVWTKLTLEYEMSSIRTLVMFENVICSSCLDLVNSNVCAKVYQNIQQGSRDRAGFNFFRIWTSAKPRPVTNGICQSLGLHIVNINMCAKFHHNISFSSRDRAIFTFSELPRPTTNSFQSLGLDLVNINVYARSLWKYSQQFKSYGHFFANWYGMDTQLYKVTKNGQGWLYGTLSASLSVDFLGSCN